jgi:hypothetical protein
MPRSSTHLAPDLRTPLVAKPRLQRVPPSERPAPSAGLYATAVDLVETGIDIEVRVPAGSTPRLEEGRETERRHPAKSAL